MIKRIIFGFFIVAMISVFGIIFYRVRSMHFQDTNYVKYQVLDEFNKTNTVDKVQFVGIKYDEKTFTYKVVIDYIQDSQVKNKNFEVKNNIISEITG